MDRSIVLAACIALTLVTIEGCASIGHPHGQYVANASTPEWTSAACAYASAFRDHFERRASFNETLARVMQARVALEEASQPDVETMARLLESANEEDRRCALAAADVKDFVPDDIARRIVENYEIEGPVGHYLGGLALGHMTDAQIEQYGRKLATALVTRPESLSVNSCRGVLLRLDKVAALDLFIRLMAHEDEELRISVSNIAFRRGGDFGREFIGELERKDMTDALVIAKKVESLVGGGR